MQHRLVMVMARSQGLRAIPLWLLVGASWAVLVSLSLSGNGAVIRHDRLLQGGPPLWLAVLLFIGGWQVMLWAMMVAPSMSAIDRALTLRRQAAFVSAYLVIWTAFGLAAFFFDMGIHATVNHSPWLTLHPWAIAGVLLLTGGVYQLTDLKQSFVTACRTLTRGADLHAADGQQAFGSGLAYGVQCLGANWALMLLAFALGAGSLIVMGAFTALMVLETTAAHAIWVKAAGYALITVGAFVLVGPVTGPLWIG
jgi:predicted metal-binding membrane protein